MPQRPQFPSSPPVIVVENLSVHAGKFRVDSVSFRVPRGSYCALMGKTGSGKTTILESICGLRHIHSGRIELDGVDVTQLKPAERNVGYVPQDGALFSTMSVRDHLQFALVIRRMPRETIQQRVDEMAELLQIGHLLDRGVRGLSGGEKQRVSLGRALAFHPTILCMDEPLSALDDETRQQMYSLLEHIRERTGVTAVHVTHNVEEANQLADMILRVDEGRLVPNPADHRSDTQGASNQRSDATLTTDHE